MKKDRVPSTTIAKATFLRLRPHQYSPTLMGFLVTGLVLATLTIPAWGMGQGPWGNSSLEFSSDGQSVAVAFARKVHPIRLIDLQTGRITKTMPVESAVTDLAFSPNGDLLAAIIYLSIEPQNAIIRVWNIHTGEEIGHINAPAIFYVSFLDNRKVEYDHFNEVMVWNIEDGTTKKTGQRLQEVTHSADFPRSSGAGFTGKGIYVTAERKAAAPIEVKRTETDEIIKQLPVDGTVQSLFFDHNGETLAVFVQKGKIPIQLWDTSTWTLRQSLSPASQPIEGTFSQDGKQLGVHLEDNTLRIWDLTTERETKSVYLLMASEELLEAAEEGHSDRVRLLISKGVDIEAREEGRRGSTAIMLASEKGNSEIIKLLFESGANVNAVGSDGSSALLLAMKYGHVEVVRLLLSIGADRHVKDRYGHDALWYAAWQGHLEIVKILIDAKADLDLALGAAKTREIVQILISAGADADGSRALVWLSQSGKSDVVALLLAAGADVNVRDESDRTPISGAAGGGHTDTVRMLIEAGADVNSRDNKGMTALIYASWLGSVYDQEQIEIARMLIDAGVDVNQEDNEGKTALYYASARRKTDLVDFLKRAGARE